MKILFEIMEKRRNLIAEKGHSQGETIPNQRTVPLVPFLGRSGLICEVKRKSPSKSNIKMGLDPVNTAEMYVSRGVSNISVLTEPNYFGGSINDLMQIKQMFPEVAVLRKDFIIDTEDIEIAWRAGADAVLLIAAVHDSNKLAVLYDYAKNKGLAVLFEVHDLEDLEKARKIRPAILGINTRDLKTFIIDPVIPIRLIDHIDWDCRLVFESGIHSRQQAAFAAGSGASALLVGESVVKNPDLITDLKDGFSKPGNTDFWKKLYTGKRTRPFVKICGITRPQDLLLADELGADIVGMILAESPRKVSTRVVKSMPATAALKAGIVVLEQGKPIPADILELLEEGHLDVLQIHGQLEQHLLPVGNSNFYQACSVKNSKSLEPALNSHCPRVLLDAFVPGLHGGTGKLLDTDSVKIAAKAMPLWIAGGLKPENIEDIIKRFKPELVDAASGIESAPGIKDHDKMKAYFKAIQSVIFHEGAEK